MRFATILILMSFAMVASAHAGDGQWEDYKRITPSGTYTKHQNANTRWQKPHTIAHKVRQKASSRGDRANTTDTTDMPWMNDTATSTVGKAGGTTFTISGPKPPPH